MKLFLWIPILCLRWLHVFNPMSLLLAPFNGCPSVAGYHLEPAVICVTKVVFPCIFLLLLRPSTQPLTSIDGNQVMAHLLQFEQ